MSTGNNCQNQDLLIYIKENLQRLDRKLDNLDDKVNKLNMFKSQLVGMSVLMSAIVALAVDFFGKV